MVDATQKLQASLAEEHRLHMMFQLNITQRIGKPMQAANVIVQVRLCNVCRMQYACRQCRQGTCGTTSHPLHAL